MAGRKELLLTKDLILRALKHTKSNMAAARYCGCSYPHYKKYAKLYKNEDGQTLFDSHLNRAGKGISKHLYKKKDITPIMDILEGRVDVSNYDPKEIKDRLIHESLIAEECCKCGFHERRVVDYKVPLILNFQDGNKRNWVLSNLELLCYNCYFLNIGNVWSDNQLHQMEDFTTENKYNNDDIPDWEMDTAHIDHLKELGLWDEEDDGEEYVTNR